MPTNFKKLTTKLRKQQKAFLARRPHRSFRLTRRRDYARPLELPGNIAFTHEVTKTLWRYKKIFIWLAVIYMVLYGVLVGIQSQDTVTQMTDTLSQVGAQISGGDWNTANQAGVVFLSLATAGLSSQMSGAQQIFTVLSFLLIWLTTVWLLRNLLAGHKVKLRDGLYNAGAPLFATILIVLLIIVQLLPIAVAAIGYNSAANTGLLSGGAAPMLFWIAVLLLCMLSLYWITSSLLAMIIVTLPGMYPYKAIKSAGNLVMGRRVKILLRWLWMVLVIAGFWIIVLLPIVLIDMWFNALWPSFVNVPLIPFVILILSSLTVVWGSAYVYLLYRKVVEYVPAS